MCVCVSVSVCVCVCVCVCTSAGPQYVLTLCPTYNIEIHFDQYLRFVCRDVLYLCGSMRVIIA
jgi:hypothetical protein